MKMWLGEFQSGRVFDQDSSCWIGRNPLPHLYCMPSGLTQLLSMAVLRQVCVWKTWDSSDHWFGLGFHMALPNLPLTAWSLGGVFSSLFHLGSDLYGSLTAIPACPSSLPVLFHRGIPLINLVYDNPILDSLRTHTMPSGKVYSLKHSECAPL